MKSIKFIFLFYIFILSTSCKESNHKKIVESPFIDSVADEAKWLMYVFNTNNTLYCNGRNITRPLVKCSLKIENIEKINDTINYYFHFFSKTPTDNDSLTCGNYIAGVAYIKGSHYYPIINRVYVTDNNRNKDSMRRRILYEEVELLKMVEQYTGNIDPWLSGKIKLKKNKISKFKDKLNASYNRALYFHNTDKYALSIKICDSIISLIPSDERAWYLSGMCFFELGRGLNNTPKNIKYLIEADRRLKRSILLQPNGQEYKQLDSIILSKIEK
jgi:tetratricopeptide (TPR) repeat protein